MKKINLTNREKEVINLAISVTSGCQPCAKYHIKKCKEENIPETEIYEIIEQSELIYKKSIEILKQKAISSSVPESKKDLELNLACENKSEILVGLSVSYTLNNTDLFDFYIKKVDQLEVNIVILSFIMQTSKFIFDKAKAHVEILVENHGVEKEKDKNDDCNPVCCC